MPRLRSALVVPVALLLALAPASLAHAEGSVPSEVSAYVSDGSLVTQLNDVYGVNAAGEGIDFDDTTKPGVIERVHVWSDELRAGTETDHPVDLLNEWTVPVNIAEAPVGLAVIWINPATVKPELASFVADPELATALSAVPDGSSLVHDVENAAWFALAADGILTPLVPGRTELSTPVPLDQVAILPATGPAPSTGDPGTGVGFAIAVVLLLLAVIVVALIVPGLRKKKPDADAEADGEAAAAAPQELEPAVAPKAIEAAAVEEPAVEEPAVEEPAVEEPAVEEPAVDEPAAEENATEKPAKRATKKKAPPAAD